MPKRLPKGKVGLYMYVKPEIKEFIKTVVKISRAKNGRYRSQGVLVEELIFNLSEKERGKLL